MAKTKPKEKMFDLSKIKQNPDNPRFITEDNVTKLKNSIKSFERMMSIRPIIYDEKNIILGGNQRYGALTKLGYKEVPLNWVQQEKGLTPEEKKEFIIKDNVGFGGWDWQGLEDNWNADKREEWGLPQPKKKLPSILFRIKCEDVDQLNVLQEWLNTDGKTIDFSTIKDKLDLK